MSKVFQYPNTPLPWHASPHDFTTVGGVHGLQLGLRTAETTQRYIYGTRHITWDGRVFKYSNAVVACYSYHGAAATEAAALSWTTNAVKTAAGATSCTVAVGDRSEDDLAGAYLMINDESATDTTWLFGIIGNEASVDSTTIVYLDGAIPVALTTSDDFEVFENPYRELSEATNSSAAWMGVPAMTAEAGYKFWLQTWGPAYISPGNLTLDDPVANERTVYWWANGTLAEAASSEATCESQHAGYILNAGSSGIAGPLIMLMCST